MRNEIEYVLDCYKSHTGISLELSKHSTATLRKRRIAVFFREIQTLLLDKIQEEPVRKSVARLHWPVRPEDCAGFGYTASDREILADLRSVVSDLHKFLRDGDVRHLHYPMMVYLTSSSSTIATSIHNLILKMV